MPATLVNYEAELRAVRNEAIRQNLAGRTWADMAYAIGFCRPRNDCPGQAEYADTSRLKRMLGMRGFTSVKHGKTYRYGPQKNSTYESLVKLVEMLGADPVDFGL